MGGGQKKSHCWLGMALFLFVKHLIPSASAVWQCLDDDIAIGCHNP